MKGCRKAVQGLSIGTLWPARSKMGREKRRWWSPKLKKMMPRERWRVQVRRKMSEAITCIRSSCSFGVSHACIIKCFNWTYFLKAFL
jgi:hypothetical protein